jgi:hypothetical protein
MLPLPKDLSDVLQLADWLELLALSSDDRNASASDLASVLEIAGGLNEEVLALEVMLEIEQRNQATGPAYPFEMENGRVLKAREDDWKNYVAYVFCLCLSFFGHNPTTKGTLNPWYLFEDLCCIAAEQYIQGKVLKFGSRGSSDMASFSRAIDELCRQIGEGQGFKEQPALHRRDDKVDLVAWKDFIDRRPSKLIMFGQCAAGANWEDKISELQPEAFWEQWMYESKTTQRLLRSFYIPHRIPWDRWQYYARRAGILFDRCRVAYWAFQNNQAVTDDPRYISWCESVLWL